MANRGWLPTTSAASAQQARAQITYETLLANMGVRVGEQGQLQRAEPSGPHPQQQQQYPQQRQQYPQQQQQYPHQQTNSYFQPPPAPRQPTLREYRDRLLADYLRRQHVRQTKSSKLLLFR
jgi:hypothetical protein